MFELNAVLIVVSSLSAVRIQGLIPADIKVVIVSSTPSWISSSIPVKPIISKSFSKSIATSFNLYYLLIKEFLAFSCLDLN